MTSIPDQLRKRPAIARPRRPPPVLLCRKCLKRSDEGRAIARALKGELMARAKARGEKRAKLVATSCFGLCPKRAVVTASGASLARGEFVLLRDEADVPDAVEMLDLRGRGESGQSSGT